jgi:site-specific DNA recombinase
MHAQRRSVARRRDDAADIDTLAYRRVSTGEQAVEWKTSLADQTRAMQQRAQALGRVLLEKYIFEDRFSGEEAESRKGFMELIAFCRAHPRPRSRVGYVLFLNDSRFGRFRDPDEAAYWRFELSKVGWQVRFAENDDTENVTTRHVMRSVGSAQASEYLANLRNNAKRGTRGAASKGLWQNEAPFGYRRCATAPGREPVVLEIGQRKSDDQQVRLTPGPEEEVRLLRWMFETYADGLQSLHKLAREMRLRAPRLKWSKQNVGKMLANRAYLGEVIWGRRPHDKQERREQPVRPREDWVVKTGAHPPLITQELFDRVQERLLANKRRTRAMTAGGYPLSGLIRCTHCGMPYIGGGGMRNPDPAGDPDRFRFYKCSGSANERDVCPGPTGTVTRRIIEPIVIEAVSVVVADPQVQAVIAEEIDRYLDELHGGSEAEVTTLTAEKKKLLQERANLAGAIARGILNDEEAATEMERIRSGLEKAETGLARLRMLDSAAADIRREKDRLVALAADFAARAKTFIGPALRELIAPWIEEATFDKQTRVLDLVIRRVPHVPSAPGGSEPLRGCGVRRTIKIPRVARDSQSGRWKGIELPVG